MQAQTKLPRGNILHHGTADFFISARVCLVTAAGAAGGHSFTKNFILCCCFCHSFEDSLRSSDGPSWLCHPFSSQGTLSNLAFVLYEMHSLHYGKADFSSTCAVEEPWTGSAWFLFLLRCLTLQFHNWLYPCWRFTDCLCETKYHRQFAVTTPKNLPPARYSQLSCYQ